MTDQVTIIGDGQMATVCGLILAERNVPSRMWSVFRETIESLRVTRENRRYLPGVKLPAAMSFVTDARQALEGSDLIVSAVPVQYVRAVWRQLASLVPRGAAVVSISKGIENETLMVPSQILVDVLDEPRVAALSGPTIAAELARRMPATAVAASEHVALADQVQRTFSTQWFRVYTNSDALGVELAAAVKNVIALAAGIIDGLGAGDNAKAALVTRGLVEITRLGMALGAKRETFAGLAGLGDLVTTCVSPSGRNRSAGEALGRGRSLAEVMAATPSVIEGIPTTRSVRALARKMGVAMPIVEAVHAVLFEGKDALVALSELMSRDLRAEE
ncbi:MAG: NAD(P)H-dependent glycerol-3-phosphate dehydrogenase [Phycisphaerae bacterium]